MVVGVLVEIQNKRVDKIFDYLVPDDLKNSIDAAIQGLNNGDVNAISLVGLDPKEWLYNG